MKVPTLPARMVLYFRRDEDSYVVLSDGYWPSPDALLSTFPVTTDFPIVASRLPPEMEAKRAALITLHAQHIASRHGVQRAHLKSFRTHVVLPSSGSDGLLASWYEGKPPEYRLMLHHGDQDPFLVSSECWRRALNRANVRRSYTQPPRLRVPALAFLESAFSARKRSGIEGLEEYLRTIGHPWTRSHGHSEPG